DRRTVTGSQEPVALFKTKNDLPEEVRAKAAKLVNARLADLRRRAHAAGRHPAAMRRTSEARQEASSFQRPSPDCVGPTRARLAGSVKRFVSLRPTSRLSPPLHEAPHLF